MPPPLFNWPPFKLVRLDADTGKPIDPNVGMRVQREFYDIKKDKNGNKMMVAHKKTEGGGKKGEQTSDPKKGNEGGKGNGKKEEGGQKTEGGGDQGKGGKEWTAEQDAKILSMKAEEKTWVEIGKEVGRGKNEVKNRHKELTKDADDKAEPKDNKKPPGEKPEKGGGGKDASKQQQPKKNKEKPENKPAAAKPPNKAPSKAASRSGDEGEARFTMGEWRTLQEDDLFSFGELQCLSELMLRDQQQRWLRIGSQFCDVTGRRVHPDDIRDKFEEMQGMDR